jgi:signal transduction histidine kinase/CheY-like chemotaxis protein
MTEAIAVDLFELAPCGYVVTGIDGCIQRANRMFRSWTGWSEEDLTQGKRFQDLLPKGARIFYETHYDPLLRMQGYINEIAVDLVCNGAERVPTLINAVQLKDARDRAVNNLIVVFRADGRRKYEQDLVEAEKLARQAEESVRVAKQIAEEANLAKSQFLANMSHEIRTPMNGVMGFAELLSASELNEFQMECVDSIRVSAEALLFVIDELLDFSKIEAGKLHLEEIPFDLREVVGDVCNLFRPQLEPLPVELKMNWVPGDATMMVGDPVRVRQILLNLVGNAVKFTPKGIIEVTIRVLAGLRTVISVRDTGIGIAADKQALIFGKFNQADSSMTRRFGGTGLGLAITKLLVQAMGGDVSFTSVAGCGSTFQVDLPARLTIGAPNLQEEVVRERLPPNLRYHLLVAEDHPVNQLLTVRLLERLGCRVDLAVDGEEARQKALQEDYDLILMDCQMPQMDGFDASREILRHKPATRIVALTANAMEDDRKRCLDAGMLDWITKPIRVETLEAAVRQWGGKPRAEA